MSNLVRKGIEVSREDLDWYEKTYPKGSLNWLLQLLLYEFRLAHKESPADYAKRGAEELKRKLNI